MLDKAEALLKRAAVPKLMSPALRAQHLDQLGDVLVAKARAAEREASPVGQSLEDMACDKASDLYFKALISWDYARAIHPALCCKVNLLLLNCFSPVAKGNVGPHASDTLPLASTLAKASQHACNQANQPGVTS